MTGLLEFHIVVNVMIDLIGNSVIHATSDRREWSSARAGRRARRPGLESG